MSIPKFLDFIKERDQLDEAFNSAPYELTMGKKNAGDVFFTFIDEDDKEYRIQFYTPQGLGKNVRQVFIGQKRGSVYPDAIARFKNPMRVIASMIEATKQFMATPLGKTIDGYAVNFSKKALDRGMTLIPKIIRQSGLKQKLNVMDLTYAPVPDRGYVWLVKKGKDPAQVFDGPKMQGITWDDPDKVGDVPVQNNTPEVDVPSPVDDSNGWKLTSGGDQPMMIWSGREKGRLVTANIAPHYNEPGVYVGAYMNEKPARGPSPDFITRQLKLPQIPVKMLNSFTTASTKFWRDNKPNTQTTLDEIPTTDMGQEGLRDGGYIARLLGIIDTYAPQMVGMYSGEKLTRVGAGRYKTSGGLVIEVHFWGVDKGNLAVEVSSELSGTEMLSLSGKTKDAGMKIVEAISRAAGSQFNGEVEVRAVPINGAPYPILKVSRSHGYSYVDCGSFVLKVSDALLERFTVGKAVELDLMREFPRTTFPVRYDWYGKTELVVKASDGKTIFGSINTNASDKDAVITANLKAPSNGTFFGETVHGFSVAWDFKFPRGGNLQDAKIVTNVTYNFDKKKANITTMIVEGHHQHSSSSYDVNLDVKTVQSVLDEYSDRLKIINQQLRNLDSSSYNPNKRFLNDVTISKSGEILFQGQSLTQSQNRQVVINALAKAQSNAEKTKGDLANYAASIEASAPQGRDLDWRVYLTNNGNSLQVDWEITFRRNTHVGAMKEFSAQVYRGNRYLEDVYADAKSRGYAPEQPNLMAMSDAQRSDDMAMMNGEDAYSEYEQSIGGSLKINLK
ncbi:phage associated protein [Klebsiella phage 0507-KN2-1]|uniref:Phage associated protein n=1 Tax=Klebsiella phage 0507-KN2-1 TaxID=2991282 RepID=S6C8L6_BPK05|nr:phage associated protein [Klebsiella phage 0507-KN2-1]BAN78356.1 phage associated protein [Klebsiella phage 0507-KN2-1]